LILRLPKNVENSRKPEAVFWVSLGTSSILSYLMRGIRDFIKKLISGWESTPSQRGSSLTKTMYSQTWVNDHLRIATTCLQRPSFWSPNLSLCNTTLPLNNDHLSTTATNLGSQGWSLYTSLTVIKSRYVSGTGDNTLKVEYKTEIMKKMKKKNWGIHL
jgi:hypothetical protein